jgi:hypothetical protein
VPRSLHSQVSLQFLTPSPHRCSCAVHDTDDHPFIQLHDQEYTPVGEGHENESKDPIAQSAADQLESEFCP